MRAGLLHVVAAYSNPMRWRSRMTLYQAFRAHMLASGVRLTVVECAYGDRPHELGGDPDIRHVPVRARTLVWVKENLLNLGIASLPEDWKYVAWIDADVLFRDAGWAAETVHALQQYAFVQPWTDCYDLGPRGEHIAAHRSFCRLWQDGAPIVQGPNASGPYRFAHPGYAWAATRQALEYVGGLIDTAAMGAADHHMAMALIGRVQDSVHGGTTAGYRRPLLRWQARAMQHIAGNIGCVGGTIEHDWHGSKDRRRYVERWDVLARNAFDPDEDLKRNVWGVLELAGNKPALARDIDAYFRARDEDSNTMAV